MRTILAFLFCLGCFLFSNAQTDTLHAVDSVIDENDCYTKFFNEHEKVTAPAKTILITREKKTISLGNFLKDTNSGEEARYTLADIDGDGKKELVTWSFSGGAHCCDELSFYKNIAVNKYQYAGGTFAGNSCISDKNEITFDFFEQFGYFFTCYACMYEDSSETAPIPVNSIILKYKNGKLVVTPGDNELRSAIKDNLSKLSERPYQKLTTDVDQDDGLRKAFALNLAVYYYSFGRNIIETKKMFDKYYKFPDAKKVWAEFVKTLGWIKKQNGF